MTYAGYALALLGALMLGRGALYALAPNSGITRKRQQRNLRAGMTTDMDAFGRRVRRLGALVLLIGLSLAGWQRALALDAADAGAAEGAGVVEAAR